MSTAGKVLIVLNTLMLAVWLVLMAGVAELDANGAKRVEDLAKEVESARADLVKVEKDARDIREQVTLEQVAKEGDLKVVRSRLSNSEREVSITLETLSRLQVEVEEFSKAVKRSQEIAEQRREEKTQLEGLRTEEEALVKRLQTDNGDLLTELQSLRETFKQVTEANRGAVSRILNGGDKPGVRAASFIR